MKDSNSNPSPPKLLKRFLQWFCDPNLVKNIEGDLLELFDENVQKNGKWIAKWHFVWDVLKLFRPGIISSKYQGDKLNSYGLFKHNALMTFRRLRKDRLYSILNLLGLSTGIAAFILLFQYIQFENSFDQFHVDSENIYRVNYEYLTSNGTNGFIAGSPPRVTPFMKEQLPEVKSYIRVNGYNASDLMLSSGDAKYVENNGLFVDENFLEFFSFQLIHGDIRTCLTDKFSIVVSESTAKKYFGNKNPIGEKIEITGVPTPFTVTGVAKDVPLNSHIQFDFLMTYEVLNWVWEGEMETWYQLGIHGFVVLEPDVNIDSLSEKFARVFEQERGQVNGDFSQSFSFQSISNIHFRNQLQFELNSEKQEEKATIQFLLIVGYFILIIAWINYINLSTARAIDRAKEVSIRKTLGAYRKQLIAQFILESFIVNLIACFFALLIIFLGSNYFYGITGIELTRNYLFNFSFLEVSISVWILGSIVAGLYPAFIISSFNPSGVIKTGSVTVRSNGLLRKLLVVLQFAASITLIISTAILYKQLAYMKNKDIGFELDNILVVKGPDIDHGRTYIQELSSHSQVLSATISSAIPGKNFRGSIFVNIENQATDMEVFADWSWIDYNYFSTLDINILEGRAFSPEFGTDSLGYVINEETAHLLGYDTLSQIIGKTLTLSDGHSPHKIIGVAENVNHLSSKNAVKPLVMALSDWPVYYVIKFKDDHKAIIESAETLFKSMYPSYAFDSFFLDELYRRQYEEEDRLSNLVTIFSSLAIFIACLGLFGLTSHNTLKRTKEIGIRKVLGASVHSILLLLSKEFMFLVILANVVTWPIIYYFMEDWLSDFAFRISIEAPVFLFSGLIVLLLAYLTVSSITARIARANPTSALRDE